MAQQKDKRSRRPSVIIVSPLPPPISGPEIMTEHLLASPLRDRFEIHHYDISKRRPIFTKGKLDILNVVYGLVQPFKLAWKIVRHRPRMMYTILPQNMVGVARYAAFIIVAAVLRVRVGVYVAGNRWDLFFGRSVAPMRWALRGLLRLIDVFHVLSEGLGDQFDGLVGRDRIQAANPGIDILPFRPAREKEAGESSKTVLFVGYLTQAKGALDLLRAAPLVAQAIPQVKFVLVGERVSVERNITYIENPEDNSRVLDRLLAPLVEEGRVECTGLLVGDAKIRAFQSADMLAFPTYAEGVPNVILEALAAGLPIVTTKVGAIPEILTADNAVLVSPGGIDRLAAAIIEVLSNTTMADNMSARNRALAGERFGLVPYADRMTRVFNATISGRQRKPDDGVGDAEKWNAA